MPYRVGIQPNPTLDVGPVTGLATLTIEAGVTLKFTQGGKLRIDPSSSTSPSRGALIAVGTATSKIAFTSAAATPAAGDWYGVWLGGVANAATRLDHVTVEYAGLTPSGSGSDSCSYPGLLAENPAAIRIIGGEPTSVFITNTTINASASHGIDRGFRSNTKPSFLATNTFTAVARCRESHPRDIDGTCPMTVPCP